jgi:DnaJ like chaperone protein
MSYTYTFWFAAAGLLLGHGIVGAGVGAIIGFVLDNCLRCSVRLPNPMAACPRRKSPPSNA